jgi:hypothetical protein
VNENAKVAKLYILGKARYIAACTECDKPRVFFSASKLSGVGQKELERLLEDHDFVCGGEVAPPDYTFRIPSNAPYSNRALTCTDPVEKLIYSAKTVEKSWGLRNAHSLCMACGNDEGVAPKDVQERLAVAKLYPLCGLCQKTRKWQTWGTGKGGAQARIVKKKAKEVQKKAAKRQKMAFEGGDDNDGSDEGKNVVVDDKNDDDEDDDNIVVGDDDDDSVGEEEEEEEEDDDDDEKEEGQPGAQVGVDAQTGVDAKVWRSNMAKELSVPKKRRQLVRTGSASNAKAEESEDDEEIFQRVGDGGAGKARHEGNWGCVQNGGAPSAISATLEAASKRADIVAQTSALKLAEEVFLVSPAMRRLRKMMAKADVKFSRQLMCFDPPPDGLCGYRALYVILQLLISKGLLLEGAVTDELKVLSTTGLREYLVGRRTLDERKRVLLNTPPHMRDWCGTVDMERFANITQTAFWYAPNGYSSDNALYRLSGFDSQQPERFVLTIAVVFENVHFQLADMSSVLQSIFAGGSAITLGVSIKELEQRRQNQEVVDLSVQFSYEDDRAMDVLLHTLNDDNWVKLFKPEMDRLGWKWVTGSSEYDMVYELSNADLEDNGLKVTGKEGLRQYFLTSGRVTEAPHLEGTRKRRRPTFPGDDAPE